MTELELGFQLTLVPVYLVYTNALWKVVVKMGISISNYPSNYSFICAMAMFKGCSAVKINGRSRMKHNSDPDFWWPQIPSILCGRGQVTAICARATISYLS